MPSASRDKRPAPSETAHNKTIERTAGAPIEAELPTVADLRARRLELTRAALRKSCWRTTWSASGWSSRRSPTGSTSWRSGPRYRRATWCAHHREAGSRGRDIGAIGIAQRFSIVEVPSPAADQVIAAVRQATIEGRQARRPAGPL